MVAVAVAVAIAVAVVVVVAVAVGVAVAVVVAVGVVVAMSDNRSPAYWEHVDGAERAVIRASALGGSCEASLVRALAGQPAEGPPAFMMEKFAQGVVAEPVILAKLAEQYGWEMVNRDTLGDYGPVQDDGQIETELAVGKHVVRCHPDGVVMRSERIGELAADWAKAGSFAVVEAKALGAGLFAQWKLKGLDVIDTYRWQVAVEMLTTGLPCVYVVGEKDADGLVSGPVFIKYYTEPPVSYGEIAAKVLRVVKAAREMEAGGPAPECQAQQFPCGFWQLSGTACSAGDRKAAKAERAGDDEHAAKIAHWARFWLTGQTIKQSGEYKMAQAKEELLKLVDGSTTVGDYEVVYRGGGKGNVSWKAVADELRPDDDERWAVLQEEHRGKPGEASVTVRLKDKDES